MLAKVAAIFTLLLTFVAQDTGTLRVRVTLTDAAGLVTPIPRVTLIVSDNPATGEPKRVRTGDDGFAELKLKPGSYIIELDAPIGFAGKGYSWTELVDVVAGKTAAVELTAKNAEVGAPPAEVSRSSSSTAVDSAAVFTKWKDSVVEIWTPTAHASGFVIDAKGLIATSHHAIAGATTVEVEIANGSGEIKVAGTVVANDRLTGAAIVWIDPRAIASAKPIDPQCGRTDRKAPLYQDELTAISAPMWREKEDTSADVQRVTSQAIYADLRLRRDDSGGPVFADSGELVGISALRMDEENRRPDEAWVVPIDQLCAAVAAAVTKVAAVSPPPATHLPLEPAANASATRDVKAARAQPPTLSSSSFDITLLTPSLARVDDMVPSPGSDFGNWAEYVRNAPPVLLIRVSPQFEESLWKTLARGAAATQGMALPPLKSFSSNFLRLRAFCGDTEVTPIHPFVIERQVSEKSTIREGLYVFDPAALGPQCASIRLSMYSEKEPQKADTKTIDAKLFQQVANSLQ